MSKTISATVVGATGYTGSEALRLLFAHPNVGQVRATSDRLAGQPLRASCPWLDTDLILEAYDPRAASESDVVFLCQSNGVAMRLAPELIERTRVIDLSADFRLTDLDEWEAWYRMPHARPAACAEAVYGLPELGDRTRIAQARLVANPGCYVTASLLALVPLERAGLIHGTPIIDAKSGVSGAGRSKADTEYLLSELAGSLKAYGVVGHRHTPEIEQLLGRPVRFAPHLLPFPRGIHATIHFPIAPGTTDERLRAALKVFHGAHPFVRVCDPGYWPSTKEVLGTNSCRIACAVDERTQLATVVSVIDNLMKGAAGQAVQNMNLMFGFPETAGLPIHGVWP
ncbi:MAG: N-acetyl-gamma-glutamyl-phosphate reductase [Burkholderiales bacterium]|nr:N-acetyl-gamma-glutamyl-phosphate reductase [Burkholderiales bacterium]